MKSEHATPADDGEDFCPHCFAREMALTLLSGCIANCVAAGCDPEDIQSRFDASMSEWFDVESDGEMDADTPTAGSA